MADWSSLPSGIASRIGDCLLTAGDIDYYMDMRAVCHNWRSATADPCRRGDLPCFRPRQWAMLDLQPKDAADAACLFVNLSTGRFLRRRLPMLRDNILADVSDGLLILIDREYPHAARVLNPITGYLLRFAAQMPRGASRLRAAVIGSEPPCLVFSYWVAEGNETHVLYAGPTSKFFPRRPSVGFTTMVVHAGHAYMLHNDGSISKIAASEQGCYGELVVEKMLDRQGVDSDLVVSDGELLLVRRVRGAMKVFRVDVERKVVEPVRSIGNRALFLCSRSLSVHADNLSTVDSGCVYHRYSMFLSFDIHRYDLQDCTEERVASPIGPFGDAPSTSPLSLVQLLVNYGSAYLDVETELIRSSLQTGMRFLQEVLRSN